VIAALFCPRQLQVLAERIEQRGARIQMQIPDFPVDLKGDWYRR
jgi:hypothetical protein